MTEDERIAKQLSVMGHPIRIAIVRLLVRAGPPGLAAGAMGRALDTAPNALTFHLQKLSHAGLVNSRREGRFIMYRAEFDELHNLTDRLVGTCCADSQPKCGPRCPTPAGNASATNIGGRHD